MDLHSGQCVGYFDIPVDHVYGDSVLLDYLASKRISTGDLVVVSPDVGGVARARAFAKKVLILSKPDSTLGFLLCCEQLANAFSSAAYRASTHSDSMAVQSAIHIGCDHQQLPPVHISKCPVHRLQQRTWGKAVHAEGDPKG